MGYVIFLHPALESSSPPGLKPTLRIKGHNTVNNKTNLTKEVAWASQNMPRTLRQVAALPDLSEVRPACCMHLDMKNDPAGAGAP